MKNRPEMAMAVAAFLSACGPNPYYAAERQQLPSKEEANKAIGLPYVGKSYWVSAHIFADKCPLGVATKSALCRTRHVKIASVSADEYAVTFHAINDDGTADDYRVLAGWQSEYFLDYDVLTIPAAFPSFLNDPHGRAAERKQRFGVCLGISKAAVLASAWDAPERVTHTVTKRGKIDEWHYPGANALFFRDGWLAKIED
jgi:hypothetical protein